MWKLGRACVIIHISGKNVERLLNALRGEDVPLSRVTRVSPDELRASIPARDFRRIRRHAGRLNCRIRIKSRRGTAFLVRRLYLRPALWLGCLIGFALLLAASTRLWFIRVEGNVRVAEPTLRRALAEYGLVVGAAKPEPAFDALADALAAYDERIAWVGLDLDGVCLTVRIREAEHDMLALDPSVPCDVVAVKSGQIQDIRVLEGVPMLAAGEFVHAGDVLISGLVELEDIPQPLFVHARGDVKARIYYFAEYTQALNSTERTETGAAAPYRRVAVCGFTVYESKPPFADFEVSSCREVLLKLPLLPVTVCVGDYTEMAVRECALTLAEAAEKALVAAESFAFLRIPDDAAIVEKTSDWTHIDGTVRATCAIVTEESIGLTKEIEN